MITKEDFYKARKVVFDYEQQLNYDLNEANECLKVITDADNKAQHLFWQKITVGQEVVFDRFVSAIKAKKWPTKNTIFIVQQKDITKKEWQREGILNYTLSLKSGKKTCVVHGIYYPALESNDNMGIDDVNDKFYPDFYFII